MSSFFLGISVLFGTIVGAGMFALPYVFARSGIVVSAAWLGAIGGVMALLHVCYGEVCLRTEGRHRLVGYAAMYLGRWGKALATLSAFVGTVGALLAYTILGGIFGRALFGSVLPWPVQTFAILFWFFCSLLVLQRGRSIAKAEFVMNSVLLAGMLLLVSLALPKINLGLLPAVDARFLFLPYGIFLFALSGGSAIPELVDLLKTPSEKRSLKSIVIACFLLVTALYLLFSLAVAGASGSATSPDAIAGLGHVLGEGAVALGSFIGLLAVATSFVVLGEYLKHTFAYDYGMRPAVSFACAMGVPLLLFLLGMQEFISVIGVTGTVMGVAEGILILILFQRARTIGRRIPEYSVALGGAASLFIGLALLGGGVAYLWFS